MTENKNLFNEKTEYLLMTTLFEKKVRKDHMKIFEQGIHGFGMKKKLLSYFKPFPAWGRVNLIPPVDVFT